MSDEIDLNCEADKTTNKYMSCDGVINDVGLYDKFSKFCCINFQETMGDKMTRYSFMFLTIYAYTENIFEQIQQKQLTEEAYLDGPEHRRKNMNKLIIKVVSGEDVEKLEKSHPSYNTHLAFRRVFVPLLQSLFSGILIDNFLAQIALGYNLLQTKATLGFNDSKHIMQGLYRIFNEIRYKEVEKYFPLTIKKAEEKHKKNIIEYNKIVSNAMNDARQRQNINLSTPLPFNVSSYPMPSQSLPFNLSSYLPPPQHSDVDAAANASVPLLENGVENGGSGTIAGNAWPYM